ncbi:MAG: M1 family aminopeptidase [Pyrinomonadaceae bacterium]
MKYPPLRLARKVNVFLLLGISLCLSSTVRAQENISTQSKALYDQIKAFSLTGGSAEVAGLSLKRDRLDMTFDGTFYFTGPVQGHVTGAVFFGSGRFVAAVPPGEFEKDNVKRLLGAELVESDFKTAVLRFSDDTFELIGKNRHDAPTNEQAQKLASEVEEKILKQTGANLSARVASSILNDEKPGFFFANFDGGRRNRFSALLDYQDRIPVANFGLNGGEKGLIFAYDSSEYNNEIWMAFYGAEDYQRGTVTYSDVNDLIDIAHYDMNLDLREHKKYLRLSGRIDAQARYPNIRAVPFAIGESLGEAESQRLKKQLRVKQVRLGGVDLSWAQEDWEGGFTVFLPGPVAAGQKLEFEVTLEGDFMYDAQSVDNCFYPRSNSTWFPRHGYLDRATFDLTFRHPKRLLIASVGERISEAPDPEDKSATVTKYRMTQPIALATFALGIFERHKDTVKWEKGWDPIPLEFNSLPGSEKAIKEDFILAELSNSLRYFSLLFGKYPYPTFGAAFHPFGFGQGFPTLLMIPATDSASKFTYVFIAHETAHQWWGDLITWRSYRDQWLSEGFAEYSGILYTGVRSGAGARDELLGRARSSLKEPPLTKIGFGKGRLVDVGPIILGHRLDTSKTQGAYQTLIYNKGALVLHMLHFLLSDPSTGDDKPFFDMMTDFVNRYRDQFASTDNFRRVANEHFAMSPIGRLYRLNNLDWFFKEWVYHSETPSYKMDYHVQDLPDGKAMLTGTVTQENVPNDWFMILPVTISFGGKQEAHGTVHALGPKAEFQIRLPARPAKVELDPRHWIISEKTSTSGK